ncbi:MAG: DUF72 domain-containing protein [Calditrichae bacterium]|nr:DUF72 domain-containing protein [Calditrichia bacterium]
MNSAKIHFGTSGWSYKDWVGPFYPEKTKQTEYLSLYARRFNTVEIDSTFYGIPRPTTVEKWRETTPENFLFSPKVPKDITHDRKLLESSDVWDEFIRTMQILGPKLGPVVLQFEYSFKFEKHFEQLKDFIQNNKYPLRLCVEVRDQNWINPSFFDFLRSQNIALVLNDLYYMPRMTEITADFTYIRFLGNRKLVPDGFTHRRIDRAKELDWWQDWIQKFMTKEIEVFVYSNNRYEGFAPGTIGDLKQRLGSV